MVTEFGNNQLFFFLTWKKMPMQCAIVPQSFNEILFINYKRIFFKITPEMEFPSSPVLRTPGFHHRIARATGSIPVQGTKILYVTQYSQKKKKKLTPKSYKLNIYKLPILLWRIQFWLVIEQGKKKEHCYFHSQFLLPGAGFVTFSPLGHWQVI